MIRTGRYVLIAATACAAMALLPAQLNAQWWKLSAPRDYEDCAARIAAASPAARASAIAECDAKFAGRRKPGGGYTYHDFMQDRHFDIAGPNPTPDELKRFDEEYARHLEERKRDAIRAAFAARQREQAQAGFERATPPQTPSLRTEPPRGAQTAAQARGAATPLPQPRPAARADCDDRKSKCSWSQLTADIRSTQKSLLGSTSRPPAQR